MRRNFLLGPEGEIVKKFIFILTALILLMSFAACNNESTQDDIQDTEQDKSTETASTTENETTTENLPPDFYPDKYFESLEIFLLFDPYNPGEWFPAGLINEGKFITENDLYIGDFHLNAELEKYVEYLQSADYTEAEKNDGSISIKTYISDSAILTFIQVSDVNRPFTLYSVKIMCGEYITPRGLRVGDSVDKVVELYGIPQIVDESIWHYYTEGFGYDLFQVLIVDHVVQEIRINLVM